MKTTKKSIPVSIRITEDQKAALQTLVDGGRASNISSAIQLLIDELRIKGQSTN
ncbi:hypothetical protein ACP3S7_30420 [Phytobacter ursingii]